MPGFHIVSLPIASGTAGWSAFPLWFPFAADELRPEIVGPADYTFLRSLPLSCDSSHALSDGNGRHFWQKKSGMAFLGLEHQ